ncbi:MAG TPA: hypothetical protein VFL91_27070 [Thermomicrobiales bacterium]|nr:hypothetical protein [Thermomicrobiales bacterium]
MSAEIPEPAPPPPAVAAAVPRARRSRGAEPPAPGPAVPPGTPVLVVAADAADRARLAAVLAAARCRPAPCAPDQVRPALAATHPAVVLLTVPRPGDAALALYRRLRGDEASAALPVVLLSRVPAAIVAARLADCPPEGLVHRPCPPAAVLAALGEALAGRRGGAPGGSARMEHYTIRYRHVDQRGRVALIVTDGAGDAYLFAAGALQARRAGPDAAARLAGRLAGAGAWTPMPPAPPYTLAGLRRLLDAAPPDEGGR